MKNTFFAFDLGERYIKVADIENKGNVLRANALAYDELQYNPYEKTSGDIFKKSSEAIVKLLSETELKKKETNIIIPDSQSYTRIIEMPILTEKELTSAIRYQADQFIPLSIDKVSLDIYVLKKDKKTNKSSILLVAAANAIIENVIRIIESSSLIPGSIESQTSAVLKLITHLLRMNRTVKSQELLAYINFGLSSSSIYLFDPVEKIPVQVHNFAIGYDVFFRDIQANFSLDSVKSKELINRIGFLDQKSTYDLQTVLASPLNEFVSEIKRFFISAREKTSKNIEEIYMMGEGCDFLGIDRELSQLLRIPVNFINLTPYFEKNAVVDYFANDWPLLAPVVGGAL